MVAESESLLKDDVVVISRLINAPRELVFQVWTESGHLTNWFGPAEFTVPSCEIDFRVGGSYRLCMRAPDGREHWATGSYVEIVPPERIVFTWNRIAGDVEDVAESVVTVTFEQRGHQTLLTLQHAGLRSAKDRVDHQGGWGECLDKLVEFVTKL
jgi:uncharacterized protein YndB with AHSA1/START domain